MATSAGDWLEDERDSHSAVRELRRLKRRAKQRVIRTILVALAVAAAVVAYKARAPRHFTSKVILRVSEGLAGDSAMPEEGLKGYVESALLTQDVLLELIDDFDLYPLDRARGDQFALDSIRDDLEVEVFQNFFAAGYDVGPRSTRIALSFRSQDREEAIAVAQEVTDRIVAIEMERREQALDEMVRAARSVLDRAQATLAAQQQHLSQLLVGMQLAEKTGDRGRAGQLRVQSQHLLESMHTHEQTVRRARQRKEDIELRRHAAQRRAGLNFEIADERVPRLPPDHAWAPLLMLGGAVFVLSLPLAAIAVGAFDRRLREVDDVERLGLPVLGRVPRFRGMDVGALSRRSSGRDTQE